MEEHQKKLYQDNEEIKNKLEYFQQLADEKTKELERISLALCESKDNSLLVASSLTQYQRKNHEMYKEVTTFINSLSAIVNKDFLE